MKPHLFLIFSLLFLFSCEHRAENVEIIYKSAKRDGYDKSAINYNQNSQRKNTKTDNEEEGELREFKAISGNKEVLQFKTMDAVKQTESQNFTKEEYHTVEAGETYYSIARLYDLNPRDLMSFNNYKEGETLHVNQKLRLKPTNTLFIKKSPESIKSQESIRSAESVRSVNSSRIASETSLNKGAFFPSTGGGKCKDKFSLPIKEKRILIDFDQIQSGGVKSDGIIFVVQNEEPVLASKDGEVVYIGDKISDYGNVVILKHKDNQFSIYGYLRNIDVSQGSFLRKGDIISYTSLKEKKFYFAIRNGKTPIKPIFCL